MYVHLYTHTGIGPGHVQRSLSMLTIVWHLHQRLLFHSDFKSKCRLLLQDTIQLILPSLLLPCRDTNSEKLSLAHDELAPCPPLAHPWPRNANLGPKEGMEMRDQE